MMRGTQVRNTAIHPHCVYIQLAPLAISYYFAYVFVYVHKILYIYTLNYGLCVLEKKVSNNSNVRSRAKHVIYRGLDEDYLYFFRVTHINSLIRLFVHNAHTSVVFYLSVRKDPDFENHPNDYEI